MPEREPDWSQYVMRILLVEDELIIALNTEADLETAGHTVVGFAMTSDEAISLADRCRPDLVLRARFESVRASRSPLHTPPLRCFCRGKAHEFCCKIVSVHAELTLSSELVPGNETGGAMRVPLL